VVPCNQSNYFRPISAPDFDLEEFAMRRNLMLKAASGAAVTLSLLVISSRAEAHMLSGHGVYRCVCAHAVGADASTGASQSENYYAKSTRYRYSNQYGRYKPPIKRMGQINVRNRNGGIR
jgi:hypothetical protein